MKTAAISNQDATYLLAVFVAMALYICFHKKRIARSSVTATFVLTFPNQIKVQGTNLMARMKISQTLIASIVLLTAQGKPTTGEAGTAQWTSSDESVATVAPNPENELEATVTAVGAGVAQIKCRVDADRDAGEGEQRFLEASGAVEVLEEEAETMELRFTDPA